MLGLDITETEKATVRERAWTVGLIPLAKLDEIQAQLEDAAAPFQRHVRGHQKSDGKLDQDAIEACDECGRLLSQSERTLTPTYRELVRWGIRAVDAPGLTLTPEQAPLAGKSYAVLPEETVERLARVARGTLVRDLARAVLAANTLAEREILGFT
jgi:hypothetical protein